MREIEELIMLNLFRCNQDERESVEGNKKDERSKEFYIADYFDKIVIEIFNASEKRLSDCMGIDRFANRKKMGISYQRYCLCGTSSREIFEEVDDYPVFTIIQVFINPEWYQCTGVEIGGQKKEVTTQTCEEEIRKAISQYLECEKKTMQWELYSLLTEGDFALIVRSSNIHDAYDISSLIRNIHMLDGKEGKKAIFFTYSITGAYVQNNNTHPAKWSEYLYPQDKVIVRMEFTNKFRFDLFQKPGHMLLELGERLFGRYDYQVEMSGTEFEEIYPFLLAFKSSNWERTLRCGSSKSQKVQLICQMINEGYISHINEKLLLKYEENSFLEKNYVNVWHVELCKEWTSLYQLNRDRIRKLREQSSNIVKQLENYYIYERNLKEYARLLGRICRVFYEINKQKELRVSLSVLIRQYRVFLQSIENYLKKAQMFHEEIVAEILVDNLKMGINTLDIYTRHMRNVNLQTLQTPNFEFQTNMSVEKILLSYSQFLCPFMERCKAPYVLSQTLHPIVVPVLEVKDLSVAVLFDDEHPEDEDSRDKLMIVNSPTFLNLCESCFLIPILFHEVAHHFRYESQEIRNECLKKYILKSVIFNMVMKVLDMEHAYNMEMDDMMVCIVERIYASLDRMLGMSDNTNLENYQYQIRSGLNHFVRLAGNHQNSLDLLVSDYISQTKKDICVYDEPMCKAIEQLLKSIDLWKEAAVDKAKEAQDEVLDKFERLKSLQKEQLLENLVTAAEEWKFKDSAGEFIAKVRELQRDEKKNCAEDARRNELFESWNRIEQTKVTDFQRLQIENLLKKYHNLVITARDVRQKMDEPIAGIDYQQLKNVRLWMSEANQILESELKSWISNRNKKLRWSTGTMSTDIVEERIRKIKMSKPEDLEKDWARVLADMEGMLDEHIYSIIEMYREVTSDLFMCAIMNLDVFGYLVVVAEYMQLREVNTEGVLSRIFWIVQCFYEETTKSKIDIDQYLYEIMYEKTEVLREQLGEAEGLKDGDLRTIKEFLDHIDYGPDKEDDEELRNTYTTRKWIIRIYRKIADLLLQMEGRRLSKDIIGEKEMWNDIMSSCSYFMQKRILQEKIQKNEVLDTLCTGISQILNCPASFYKNRKSLLNEEINFILQYYEECCKNIWKKPIVSEEGKEEGYVNGFF